MYAHDNNEKGEKVVKQESSHHPSAYTLFSKAPSPSSSKSRLYYNLVHLALRDGSGRQVF